MKKGFTLIELLAVIVILAIIALIAVPRVMDAIDDARKGAFENQEHSVIKAAENYLVSNKNVIPNNIGEGIQVDIEDLIDNSFLTGMDNNCEGYVVITSIGQNNFEYIPHVKCGEEPFSNIMPETGLVLDMPLGNNLDGGNFENKVNPSIYGININDVVATEDRHAEMNASYFNGDDSYISLNTPQNLLNDLSNITIMAWVKTTNSGHGRIVTLHRGSSAGSSLSLMERSGRLNYFLRDTGSYNDTGASINSGDWTHVALTYNESTYKAYVNGVEVHRTDAGYSTLGSYARNIGTYSGSTYTFEGDINEVRIYDRPLSEVELRHVYELGLLTNEYR